MEPPSPRPAPDGGEEDGGEREGGEEEEETAALTEAQTDDAVFWLQRNVVVFRVYGLLLLETAITVLFSTLVWLGYPQLSYRCQEDPSPLLLSCTPVLVLGILEGTDYKHPSNALVLGLYVAFLSFSAAVINFCSTVTHAVSSAILTWALFVACNGVAWEHRLRALWRDALFTTTLLTVVMGILASSYQLMHKMLLCLYTVFVGCILAVLFQDVRHVATELPVDQAIRGSLLLYSTEMLIYHTTLLVLTPVMWSARWDLMFSYLSGHRSNATLSAVVSPSVSATPGR
ncbi:membrane protein US14 [Panine betaherpesvirus 2]|uniref:Membrane protein US14 n=1 Tax=Panine betaherpesvirus 2 TaxID=188763 RepID=Q8QRU5_9BETA|nr:membrane protein US14 [Panine betaherpesvirus 2]AAM00793.1 membrane protein US14 [Panine betaherpesvirus 2]QXV67911.1 membrane protein US14 [Panine betaherpesvirus 2]